MSLPDDTTEYRPTRLRIPRDESTRYYVIDERLMCGGGHVRGADIPSFRFYRGGFAKDRRYCYCGARRLRGADPASFRALNYTYAADNQHVWTLGGRLKDADRATFVICDDGFIKELPSGNRFPYGFGKDASRVYYYDFDGKPNQVRKADPESFVSLNDGFFGKDARFVFCGRAVIPNAKVAEWRKLGGYYSRDTRRVYYFNREIREADLETFEVAPTRDGTQLARDRHRCYWNDRVVAAAKFEEMVARRE